MAAIKGFLCYTGFMADLFRPISNLRQEDAVYFGSYICALGELSGKSGWKNNIPAGFVLSKEVYEQFIEHNNLKNKLKTLLARVDIHNHRLLEKTGRAAGRLFLKGSFSDAMKLALEQEYKNFNFSNALIRSFAVAPELEVSFLRKRFFGVTSLNSFFVNLKLAMAAHFDAETITTVLSKGYDYRSLPLAFALQETIRGDVSGEASVQDASTMVIRSRMGFRDTAQISETDTIYLPGLKKGLAAVIKRDISSPAKNFIVSEKEIISLGKLLLPLVEELKTFRVTWVFEKSSGHWWLLGAERLPVKLPSALKTYSLKKTGHVLTSGLAVGEAIAVGSVVIASTLEKALSSRPGSILAVRKTDSRFDPALARSRAVVTGEENADSHTAQFCRERGIPLIIGVKKPEYYLKEGQLVTVSCAEGLRGKIYPGALPFTAESFDGSAVKTKTNCNLRLTDSISAETMARLPVGGIGFLAEEQLYAKYVGIHPLALTEQKKLPRKLREAVRLFAGREKPAAKATRLLAEELARAAVAFQGREVVFRLSAATSDEYATLTGGLLFESTEKNPLVGKRGVSRFIDPAFEAAFRLTTEAVKLVREGWGLTNVSVLIPFCRTIEEGRQILALLGKHGLKRGENGLKIYVMCEIPANALLAKEFIKLFDGFSVGLQHLTELTFGLDAGVFSLRANREEDRAIKKLLKEVIQVAHKEGKTVGICDTTAGDYTNFVSFLVQEGIDSITVTPDRWRLVQEEIAASEKRLAKAPLAWPLRLTSGAVSLAGFAGLSILLAGYTCQTVNVEDVKKDLQTAMEQRLALFKDELEQKVASERAEEKAARLEYYHERGFADFSLAYPFGWKFTNLVNGVEFRDASSTAWFTVNREPRLAMKEYNFAATSTWLGNDVGLYGDESKKGIVIFPNDKIFKETVVIEGDREHFDKILESIKNFVWLPKLK